VRDFILEKHMDSKKIYLTKDGLGDLKKEYEELSKVKRPDILERVSQARSMGDLSENAEYVAAREELSFIDGRIDELEELIKQAVLIQDSHPKGNHVVKLGSTVTVNVRGKKEMFTVVGEWEADPKEKKISHESPLGKALLGKKIGEKVEVEAPAGKLAYTIVSVN
jgi:transcription elongation factor GreA